MPWPARAVRTTVRATVRAVLCAAVFVTAHPAVAQSPVSPPLSPPVLPAAPDSVIVPAPLTGVQSVSLSSHACAVVAGAGAGDESRPLCWGNNQFGQLGVSSPVSSSVPIEVPGLAGVVSVTTGSRHTCALLADRTLACWGGNNHGQLGDGTTTNRVAPNFAIPALTDVRAVSAGGFFTCALAGGTLAAGASVRCWGQNDDGQIGLGNTVTPQLTPVAVANLPGMSALATGGNHACAIRGTLVGDHLVRCWGQNNRGQVGVSETVAEQPNAVTLTGLGPALAVVGGLHNTCAVLVGGAPRCWGDNQAGQLGSGISSVLSSTPQPVQGLPSGVAALGAGDFFTCALTTAGALYCWGHNIDGELGDGSLISRETAGPVVGMASGVLAIRAGSHSVCAIQGVERTLYCWGGNNFGKLGNGTFANSTLPTPVSAPQSCFALVRVAAGNGPAPLATPPRAEACPPGHYLPGQTVALLAAPVAGQRVKSWTGVSSGAAGDLDALRLMPSADVTATVTYEPCFALTLARTGGGSAPQAAPARSLGCAPGQYAAGESITFAAIPNAGQRVQAWSGATATPAAGSQVNALVMPAAARTVSVGYETCFALSVAKEGDGSLPQAAPTATSGCLTGGFAVGEAVTVQAQPAAGWVVAGWRGTLDDDAASTTNTVQIGGAQSVTVIYVKSDTPPAADKVFLPLVGR